MGNLCAFPALKELISPGRNNGHIFTEWKKIMNFEIQPIGYVRSQYKEKHDAPRQGRLSDTVSEIVIDGPYLSGLKDVDKKAHLIVLSWFD